jgi:hypothetical protein
VRMSVGWMGMTQNSVQWLSYGRLSYMAVGRNFGGVRVGKNIPTPTSI